jgi:nitrate reductase assembly molybdenum cofactor insertion protein NarJ
MRLHGLFADILESPKPLLSHQVNECVSVLSSSQREAAGLMNRFKRFVEETPFRQIEEIYGETFRHEGVCYPYVGYHLFGDGSHRKVFLAGLEEQYQIHHFFAADEAADHIGIMLRFLARVGDEEEREEFIFLHILPALKRMLRGFVGRRTPYKEVLRALLLVLREGQETQNDLALLRREASEFSQGR